jgi:phosphatidylglycerol:prolipoprotein diacylglycerol transferase
MLTLFRNFFSPPRHIILLAIAAWIGISLAEKRANRHNLSNEDLNNITFYGIIALVIGGRLSFVLQNISAFIKSPLGIISINPDLFDAFGGIVTAVIIALIYGQRKGLKLWSTLDALTPFFAVIAIGLGLSHLAAGTFFGKETTLPIGIDLWNATRHPAQIYETIAALLIFGLIWLGKEHLTSGISFLTFAAGTAFSQVIIQSFRADATLILGRFNQTQMLAWFALAACFILFETRLKGDTDNG